jgi:hypothetical protein
MRTADISGVSNPAIGVTPMLLPSPLSLVPGSWDDIVARTALKAVDWLHDRLSRRVPTLAAAPLPADPLARMTAVRGRDAKPKGQ